MHTSDRLFFIRLRLPTWKRTVSLGRLNPNKHRECCPTPQAILSQLNLLLSHRILTKASHVVRRIRTGAERNEEIQGYTLPEYEWTLSIRTTWALCRSLMGIWVLSGQHFEHAGGRYVTIKKSEFRFEVCIEFYSIFLYSSSILYQACIYFVSLNS